jgi:hypothetical protein
VTHLPFAILLRDLTDPTKGRVIALAFYEERLAVEVDADELVVRVPQSTGPGALVPWGGA